jgi:uncharacterized coiled-coil protein SlyX
MVPSCGKLQLSLGSCGVTGNLGTSALMFGRQMPAPLSPRTATDSTTLCKLEHRNHHLVSYHIIQHPSANLGIGAAMGLMKAKAKKCRRLREVKSAAEAEIESTRSESAEALQGNVAEAELTMKKLKKELNATKQQLKSTEMSAADSATALRSEHE